MAPQQFVVTTGWQRSLPCQPVSLHRVQAGAGPGPRHLTTLSLSFPTYKLGERILVPPQGVDRGIRVRGLASSVPGLGNMGGIP